MNQQFQEPFNKKINLKKQGCDIVFGVFPVPPDLSDSCFSFSPNCLEIQISLRRAEEMMYFLWMA